MAGHDVASADRPLTPGEIALARSVFGAAIDYAPVRIRARKWAFFQPRRTVMAPMGHMHFHPAGDIYCDDFCAQPITRSARPTCVTSIRWERMSRV